MPSGHPARILRFGEVTSTMDVARERLLAGETTPFWLTAERQNGGRGRHGRSWASPPGNLYATLALSEPCRPEIAPQLGFVAGLALHEAVASITGLRHPALAIKWPNDLLLDNAKLAGLLLEGSTIGGRFHVLIGFGVNIASAPDGTPYPATSLLERVRGRTDDSDEPANPRITPETLLEALAEAWREAEALWRQGFALIREAWLARAALIGESISVKLPAGERRGVMAGVDAEGRLLLNADNGRIVIDAGDVFPLG